METQPTLVGADGVVEFDAEAALHMDLAFVILPGHPEDEYAVGLDQSFENLGLLVLGVTVQAGDEGIHHFLHGLMEFRLGRMLGDHVFQEGLGKHLGVAGVNVGLEHRHTTSLGGFGVLVFERVAQVYAWALGCQRKLPLVPCDAPHFLKPLSVYRVYR